MSTAFQRSKPLIDFLSGPQLYITTRCADSHATQRRWITWPSLAALVTGAAAPRQYRLVCAGPQCAPICGRMDDQHASKAGSRSRRPPKRPQQFMFIDSTGANGVNAKPDKNVRSFVMKSARSKKPWSTRQKEKSNSPAEDSPQPLRDSSRPEDLSPTAASPTWQHAAASPATWSTTSNLSPVSSRHGSILSSRSRSEPYITPPLSTCNLCDSTQCAGDMCQRPHPANQLTTRNGFNVGFMADLDCLPVPTDANTKALLRNCKSSFKLWLDNALSVNVQSSPSML